MYEEAEPAEGRLALHTGDQVVGEPHPLNRRAEHEFARVQDERFIVLDRQALGQVFGRLAHVDVGIAVIPEDAEVAIETDVERRRLDRVLADRVDRQPSGGKRFGDRAVAEDHLQNLRAGRGARHSTLAEPTFDPPGSHPTASPDKGSGGRGA